MKFEIAKCAMLVMKKVKIVKVVGIELTDGKVVKSLQQYENFKYLGILNANKFLAEEIKVEVPKKYLDD